MKPIALFFHGLFFIGNPPRLLPSAVQVIREQMRALKASGLLVSATEFHVGINGGKESEDYVRRFFPRKAKVTYHGLKSRAENLTVCMMQDWVKTHPGWYCLYHHAKSATHDQGSDYGKFSTRWRKCMEKHCVTNWRTAVAALDAGYEAAGVHWLTGMGHDKSQHFFAGNYFWVTSDFFATIPSMYGRDRIKESGIAALESRYESEVVIGNGPRLPKIKDFETTHGLGGCP